MKTRKEIEKKEKEIFASMVSELQKFRDENPAWYFGLGKEVDAIYERFKKTVQLFGAVRFIDFLSGDDQRERWECPNTTCSRKCVLLQTKGMTKPILCTQIKQLIEWKKVGGE